MFSDCLLKLKWGFCRLYCFWKFYCCNANRRGVKVVWQSLNSASSKPRLRGSDQHASQVRQAPCHSQLENAVKRKRKVFQELNSYADAASVPKTLETLWNFHEWRPLAKGPLPLENVMKLEMKGTEINRRAWASQQILRAPNQQRPIQSSPSRTHQVFPQRVRSLIAWSWKLCPITLVLRELRILQKGRVKIG